MEPPVLAVGLDAVLVIVKEAVGLTHTVAVAVFRTGSLLAPVSVAVLFTGNVPVHPEPPGEPLKLDGIVAVKVNTCEAPGSRVLVVQALAAVQEPPLGAVGPA